MKPKPSCAVELIAELTMPSLSLGSCKPRCFINGSVAPPRTRVETKQITNVPVSTAREPCSPGRVDGMFTAKAYATAPRKPHAACMT